MTSPAATIADLKMRNGLALAQTLRGLPPNGFSERELSDRWLDILRREPGLFQDGWYSPPPHGIIAAFGHKKDGYARVCQSSFRPEPLWPSETILYSEDDIIAAYASPVQAGTYLIGDFGLCLYRGNDPALKEHFSDVLHATMHVARAARVGMTLNDLYALTIEHGRERGLTNGVESPSDPTGTNTGHTIPFSYGGDPAPGKNPPFDDVKDKISKARKFVNAVETRPILETMALTIEPRFSAPGLPNAWFHTTVIFERGEKTICHGFRPVMETFGMDYLLKHLN